MDIGKQYDSVGKNYIDGRKNIVSVKNKKSKDFIFENVNFIGKIVLDLGCGFGAHLNSFEKKGAKEVHGIDNSELMIYEAKKVAKNPNNILVADISKLPFSKEKFDIIVAKHSLHYVEHMNPAWNEICRVLKKGGIFIFTVPHPFFETFIKKNKDYSKKDKVIFKAHNKFLLEFPSHTISEYMNEKFFKLFDIEKIFEFSKEEEKVKEIVAPVVFGIKAKKK